MDRILTKTQRWRNLEQLLASSSSGVKISELAQKLRVHRSTVYRDIEQISEVGLPIWQEGGVVGLMTEDYLRPLKLNIYEAMTVFGATRLLTQVNNERNPHVESLLRKLAESLPQSISQHVYRSADFINMLPEDDKYTRNLETLMWAWLHQRRVNMGYQSIGKDSVKERLFDVYFIEPLAAWNSYYAIGLDHWYNEVRIFKIKRIRKIEITSDTYTIHQDIDLFEHWGNSWGVVLKEKPDLVRVRLRFTKKAADWARDTVWHHSESIETLSDGGCIYSVNIDSWLIEMDYGFKSWVRWWGPDVEVLEPIELRVQIAQEANKAASIYNSGDNS